MYEQMKGKVIKMIAAKFKDFSGMKDRITKNRRYNKAMSRVRKWFLALLRSVFLIGVCFVILYPVIQMISSAFMSKNDIFDNSVILFPKEFSIDNIKYAWEQMDYPEAFKNSMILCIGVTVLQTVSCLLTGYGFARFQFPGNKILFAMVIFTLIVPPQLLMISMYIHFQFFDIFGIFSLITGENGINLLGSFTPFFLLSATGQGLKNGLFIFLFRQYFKGLPKETEEAALVDGAGAFRTFFRIMLPGAITMITTVALFSFVWQFNDVTYSGLFLGETKVLSTSYSSLGLFTQQQLAAGGAMGNDELMDPYVVAAIKSTGVLLMMAPLIILYCFSQRFFIDGVERSGLVG